MFQVNLMTLTHLLRSWTFVTLAGIATIVSGEAVRATPQGEPVRESTSLPAYSTPSCLDPITARLEERYVMIPANQAPVLQGDTLVIDPSPDYGSGFLLDENHILTAAHVAKSAYEARGENISIQRYSNGKTYFLTAMHVAIDTDNDLALLKIKDTSSRKGTPLPMFPVASSVAMGDIVFGYTSLIGGRNAYSTYRRIISELTSEGLIHSDISPLEGSNNLFFVGGYVTGAKKATSVMHDQEETTRELYPTDIVVSSGASGTGIVKGVDCLSLGGILSSAIKDYTFTLRGWLSVKHPTIGRTYFVGPEAIQAFLLQHYHK